MLLYCSCNFILFSLAEGSWCSSDQAPSPQSVCKYNFISVPGSGGITEQNVSLVFILSPSISLSLPFSHKYYDHFIYCILGGFILFLWGGFVVGRRVYFVRSHQCPCHAKYSNFQDYWTLIQTWECFPIKVLYLQVHILASRWNYILFSLM